MKRIKQVALAAIAVLLLVPAIALAGHPKPGGTYRALTSAGDRLTLKVSNDGTKYFVKYVNPCGVMAQGSGLAITRGGFFGASGPPGEVHGHFVSKQKAVGTVQSPSCSDAPGTRRFVATMGG